MTGKIEPRVGPLDDLEGLHNAVAPARDAAANLPKGITTPSGARLRSSAEIAAEAMARVETIARHTVLNTLDEIMASDDPRAKIAELRQRCQG